VLAVAVVVQTHLLLTPEQQQTEAVEVVDKIFNPVTERQILAAVVAVVTVMVFITAEMAALVLLLFLPQLRRLLR
jgi:hypothetical protein